MGSKRKSDQSSSHQSQSPNKKKTTSPTLADTTLLRKTILDILSKRQLNATCCPSEVPRQCFPDNWREWMQPTRDVALAMMKEGTLEITQKGVPIDPLQPIIGPCRLRLNSGEKSEVTVMSGKQQQ